MKEIDPIMKQTFLRDYNDYLTIIKAIETGQLDAELAIEQLQSLIQDVIDDIFIMDLTAHDFFTKEKTLLGQENKEKKERRKQTLPDPVDAVDRRNQQRLLLQYDIEKHKKLLAIIKKLAYEQGWFR
ncbi:MAG TPA: hypothetical protein VMY59_01070 [Candidatus Thermoplasmatota archaeon]|nr:hypothetical protein [Candidatus Thermoplasmatota archaeon]